MSKRPKDYLTNVIRNGVNVSSMAGWAMNNSGPLGDGEIDSLVDMITKWNKPSDPSGLH